MRVMLVSRMFTGFTSALSAGRWPPDGAPAIYQLINQLVEEPDIEPVIVLVCKDEEADRAFAARPQIALPGLSIEAVVVPYHGGGLVGEFLQLLALLALQSRFRADAVYFTNANFVAASVFARLRLARTVLRFMGLFPFERTLAEGRGNPAIRWLYRAPFSHVICTQEGSGAEVYLPRLLAKGTPLSILLNGVDRVQPVLATDALRTRYGLGDRPLVLFLGRLENYKGVSEFVEGALRLLMRRPGCAVFAVVGDGALRLQLEARIRAADQERDVRLIGTVPHKEVSAWYSAADVYVSLNKHGNLSNANLEALACGSCMVLLEADPATATDIITERLIPPETVPRVRRAAISDDLVSVLEALLDNPRRREDCGAAVQAIARQLVRPWSERIARDVAILRGEASAEIADANPGSGSVVTI